MTDPAMDDAVSRDWYERSRRVAAWAWLYHAGLVVFSAVLLHGRGDRRTRFVWSATALRDVVAALLWRRRVDPPTIVAAAFATDVVAGFLLRDRITSRQFREDRSIGQLGTAPAWALLLDRRDARAYRLLLIPLSQQLIFSRIWRLGPRETSLYLTREIAWSAASLWAVAGLKTHLEDAARVEQRIVDARRETAKLADEKAAEAGVWFRFHERLSVFNSVRSRVAIQALGRDALGRTGYRRVEDLAHAEYERFRRDAAFLTLDSLVMRLLATRAPDDGSTWPEATDDEDPVELDLALDEIRWLLAGVQLSEGPLTVRTSIGPGAVDIEVRSPQLIFSALASGWEVRTESGSSVLRGSLARRT